MTFGKKIAVTALAFTLSASLFSGLPFGNPDEPAGKIGFVRMTSAAEAPPKASLERLYTFHNALTEGDSSDVQAIQDLRVEIAELDDTADQSLIDPVWNKISLKLPAYVDQLKLKSTLFRFVKAVKSYLLDPQESQLEVIRNDSEFRSALQTISAAAGLPSLTIEDFLIFLFGDGSSRPGLEGTLRETLRNKAPNELAELINDKQRTKDLLFQETVKLLGLADKYPLSRVLRNLGVKSQDVQGMSQNFEMKLQKDEAAFIAMAIAYMRSNAQTLWSQSHFPDLDEHQTYRSILVLFGAYVAPYPDLLPISMTKISGSPDLDVSPSKYSSTFIGLVTLNNKVRSAEAVIQIKLLHPFGGPEKVILEKEIRHAYPVSEFPAEPFFDKMDKLRKLLAAGNPSDMLEVRRLHDEITALDDTTDQILIDPVWNKIEGHLRPAVDKQKMKLTLFQMLKEAATFNYAAEANDLETFLNNPDYNRALFNLKPGYFTLSVDDFMIFLFGDGDARKGVYGTLRELIANLSPEELITLLYDDEKRGSLLYTAINTVISQTDDQYYKFSNALNIMGVTSEDIWSVVQQFQNTLEHDHSAISAMLLAYLQTETIETVKITSNGKKHNYALRLLGIELPSYLLNWTKISGSDAVTVKSNGTVSIPNKTDSGTAVIQASMVNPFGKEAKVIFQKEVTLVNGNVDEDE